jgi:hypothetical protein
MDNETIEIKKIKEILAEMRSLRGKAIRVAEYTGGKPTNRGAIAMARIDGYNCCLYDLGQKFCTKQLSILDKKNDNGIKELPTRENAA